MRTPSSAWHAYVKSARRPTLAKISQTTGHALALSRRTLKRLAHLYGATLSRLRLTSGHKHQKELRSRSSITRDSLASCGNAHDHCLHEWRLLKQGHSSAASGSRTVCKAYSKGALFRNREQWLLYHAASVAKSCPSRQNTNFFLGTSECATSNACTMLAVAPTVDQVAVARAMLSSAGC